MAPGPQPRDVERRAQAFELGVFLLLIVPSVLLQWRDDGATAVDQDSSILMVVLSGMTLMLLVIYFNWRAGDSARRLGWTGKGIVGEAVLGLVLFLPASAMAGIFEGLLRAAGVPGPTRVPTLLPVSTAPEIVVATVLVGIIAVSEETVFRGYLVLRLRNVTHSSTAAVLGSSFVFSLGHAYQGLSGMITVGFLGILLAVLYLWRQSLIAPIVIHFLQNFVGLVVWPHWQGGSGAG